MNFKRLLSLLRPHHWVKNLMLFFPPFLGGELFTSGAWFQGALAFVSFCLASSAVYIFNDILDRDQDRVHPRKCKRPIASGAVSVSWACCLAALFFLLALLLASQQPGYFWSWLVAYVFLSAMYSLKLKQLPVFDIFCIASGFVFRLLAGGEVFSIRVSAWLFLSVFLLSLFLSAGKRLSEKSELGDGSAGHRPALDDYPPGVLEGFMNISGAAVLVTYTLYVITMHRLVYTVPLCCFGLFRYLLVVRSGGSGDPTDSLLKDPVMFAIALIWVVMVGAGLYFA